MNHQDLHLLLEFNYWARDRILDAVAPLSADQYTRDLGNSFKSIRDTLAHTYSAEWVWYSRWQGTSPTAPLTFEDYPDVPALRAAWAILEGQIRAFVGAQNDATLTKVYDYRLMNGTPGRSIFWQMFQHVVNHGSYHRGQVTTMLRQMGVAPPKSTDMITFYRERAA
jgi:uncharacterized damage-inducible protein DinB